MNRSDRQSRSMNFKTRLVDYLRRFIGDLAMRAVETRAKTAQQVIVPRKGVTRAEEPQIHLQAQSARERSPLLGRTRCGPWRSTI